MESNNQLLLQEHQLREDNAQVCANFFRNLTGAIEKASPAFRQLFYDFSHLRKGETIMGCATQSEWARKYANKSAEALRLTLKRSLPESDRKKDRVEQNATTRPQLPSGNEDSTKPTFVGLTSNSASTPTDSDNDVNEQVSQAKCESYVTTPVSVLPDESQLQKLRADLISQRALVEDLKRLVKLVLGDEANLWHLSDESRRLYDRLMS